MTISSRLVGVHSMVFSEKWDAVGAARACQAASAAGFNTIEISLMPATIDCDMTVRLLSQHNLTPTCSLGLTFDTDISSTNPEIVSRGESALFEALEVAAKIGSRYLCGVLYSSLGKYRAPATSKNFENAAGVLCRLCTRAESLGVTIGLEPCNRYETNLLNTCKETVDFIEKDLEAHPNCVVHLDAYHMHIEERYEDAIKAAGFRAGYFHIGENRRGALGTGNIDFKRIFKALSEIDYNGPIVFESFSKDIMNGAVVEALAIWRTLWTIETAGGIASDARKFIANHMEEEK